MDMDEEIAKFKWLLIVAAMFLFSTFFSYQELKFFIWGKTVEARITETRETIRRRRGRETILTTVKYTFTDDQSKSISERDTVPESWDLLGTTKETIEVQYLSGVPDSSRLKGNSNSFYVWIFFGCTALLGFTIFKLYREASEAIHGKKNIARSIKIKSPSKT